MPRLVHQVLPKQVQGAQRMRHSAAPRPGSPIVRIVQPDVPQLAKYDEDNFRSIFDSYVDLKMGEIIRFEHTPHPVEFEMYYSA